MILGAVVLMTSTANPEANWNRARRLVECAAGYGANFVATHENSNFVGPPAENVRVLDPDTRMSPARRVRASP